MQHQGQDVGTETRVTAWQDAVWQDAVWRDAVEVIARDDAGDRGIVAACISSSHLCLNCSFIARSKPLSVLLLLAYSASAWLWA
ncbi:MAG: hypothetical protein NW220_11910 [Leptolyngbyaceae cyanobacterium bins.349]|nr:hypothetical protein [Leptolyngbyaceae cyanobacterium bins.349]